jgi:class 3 adenylate cyclase/tetratricopeptide (TPR) repeat protein
MGTETVVVMFTDLVGSTRLLSRVGDRRAEELRREHLALVRGAVEEFGGREVKNLGDGVMAAFGVPTAAVNAAVAIQQRLEVRNRRAEELLEVRVGLSVGEADVEDGDYFGAPVVEASRLCALAEGGQVLTTELLRGLAGTRSPHRFEALGTRQLKGLDAPVGVCDVGWLPLMNADAIGVPLPGRLQRPAGAPFVGRAAGHAVLGDALKEAATSGRRRIVLVSGEPGIGKTTLLADFAATAREAGAIVTYGRWDEDLAIPYQPWREVLAHLDEHAPALLEEHRDALEVLLRAGTSPGTGTDADSARYVLYTAVIDTLVRASVEAPIVVVLEDLHWADAPSVALARQLVQSPAQLRLLVVATFRDAELGAEHPVTGLLAALHREHGIERLALRGLDDLELLDLLETLAGHEMDDQGLALRDALRAETDGNPFFATEILRHLAETGAISQQEDGQWIATTDLRAYGLPVSVREVIGLRVARLGDGTRQALRCAAVMGREFELGLLAELLDRDEDATYDLLVAAVESAVLTEVAASRFSFTHALIGHALYDELTPTALARAHHAVAEALERRIVDDRGARSGELAHHWALAIAPRDVDKAAVYARQAGDYALSQLAPEEAVRWYGRALELVDPNDELRRCELLVSLGEAQRQAGRTEYRSTLLQASHQALALDATDLLVRAALANNRGFASEFGAVDDERVAMLRAAITARGDGKSGALLHGLLAAELWNGDRPGAQRAAERAVALARGLRDDRTLARVLTWVLSVRSPDTLGRRMQLVEEARAAAERTGDPVLRAAVATKRAASLEVADVLAHDRALDEATQLLVHVREPYLVWCVAYMTSVRRHLMGDLGGAESAAERALELGLATGQPEAFRFYAAQLFEVRRAQGRLGEIIDVLGRMVLENSDIAAFRAGMAAALCDLDRLDEVRQLLEDDFADGFARYPFDISWSSSMLYLSEACNQLGAREPASALAELIEPWRHQVAYTSITCGGSLARGLGLAHVTCGRHDEAVRAFRQALDVNRRLEAPILVATTELDLARVLRQTDPVAARELATAAATTAARLELGPIARRTRQLLDELP